MTPLIPLSRLSRLVGQPRSVLQRMAQSGELETFDGHVSLDEVLSHFPDVELSDDVIEPRKSDINVGKVILVWLPFSTDLRGRLTAAF